MQGRDTFYEKLEPFIQHPFYRSRAPGRPGHDTKMQNVAANVAVYTQSVHLQWCFLSSHILSILNVNATFNSQRKEKDRPSSWAYPGKLPNLSPISQTRHLASYHPNAARSPKYCELSQTILNQNLWPAMKTWRPDSSYKTNRARWGASSFLLAIWFLLMFLSCGREWKKRRWRSDDKQSLARNVYIKRDL